MMKLVGRFLKWLERQRAKPFHFEDGKLYVSDEAISTLSQAPFPHCDSEVLHAPGECVYCDHYPHAQAERSVLGINFTGHVDPDKKSCPSTRHRSLETIEKWPGNRPRVFSPKGVELFGMNGTRKDIRITDS